jgi:hypothetical protein
MKSPIARILTAGLFALMGTVSTKGQTVLLSADGRSTIDVTFSGTTDTYFAPGDGITYPDGLFVDEGGLAIEEPGGPDDPEVYVMGDGATIGITEGPTVYTFSAPGDIDGFVAGADNEMFFWLSPASPENPFGDWSGSVAFSASPDEDPGVFDYEVSIFASGPAIVPDAGSGFILLLGGLAALAAWRNKMVLKAFSRI